MFNNILKIGLVYIYINITNNNMLKSRPTPKSLSKTEILILYY